MDKNRALTLILACCLLAAACLPGCGKGIEGRYDLTRVTMYGMTFEGDDLADVFASGDSYIEIIDDSNLVICIDGDSAPTSYRLEGDELLLGDVRATYQGDVTLVLGSGKVTLTVTYEGLYMTLEFTKG